MRSRRSYCRRYEEETMTEVNHTPQLEVKKFELGVIETNLNELEAYVN